MHVHLSDTTPRVRGLPLWPEIYIGIDRYNPACAGTTTSFSLSRRNRPIQPRVCGDYLLRHITRRAAHDTTPRVRGLPEILIRRVCRSRYNPACAGTTKRYGRLIFTESDTTPRVRGLRTLSHREGKAHRYNPACAGTTEPRSSAPASPAIQPRVCGDYLAGVSSRRIKPDTTPRVRGLQPLDTVTCPMCRYNPACAGTTVLPTQ